MDASFFSKRQHFNTAVSILHFSFCNLHFALYILHFSFCVLPLTSSPQPFFSIIPLFQCSNIPLLHYSITPSFYHSNIPLLRYSIIPIIPFFARWLSPFSTKKRGESKNGFASFARSPIYVKCNRPAYCISPIVSLTTADSPKMFLSLK
jgi:hypothetical protein